MFKVPIPIFHKLIWVGVGNIVNNLIHNLVAWGLNSYPGPFKKKQNIRNFTLFSAARKNYLSVRCVAAANWMCNDMATFSKQIRTLKHILP
jgi:hypothetical protein